MQDDSAIFSFLLGLRSSLLGDNFQIKCLSWNIEAGQDPALLDDPEVLRREGVRQVRNNGWPEELSKGINTAYIDLYCSGFLAAHAFALNLLRIEEDNWFSFDEARKACAWFEEPVKLAARRELILFKGVNAKPILPGKLVAPDLPLVVDHGEGSCHIIAIGLAD